MTLFSDSAAIGQGRLVARTRHEASENVSRKITGSQVVEKLLPNFSYIGGTKNSIAFNSIVMFCTVLFLSQVPPEPNQRPSFRPH